MLPAGFRYPSLGWTGDAMSSGARTPSAHDGMAAFLAGGRHLGWSGNASELAHDERQDGGQRRGHLAVLVRNHEQGRGTPFSGAAYDLEAAGGTTTLVFDADDGGARIVGQHQRHDSQLRRRPHSLEQLDDL